MNDNNKNPKKSSRSRVAELTEAFTVQIPFCIDSFSREPRSFNDSEVHSVFGHDWLIRLFPEGTEEESNSIGLRLIHLSKDKVHITYELTLISTVKDLNVVWTDPEGIMEFEGVGGNNEWGNDDFIDIDIVKDVDNGYLIDGNVHIGVYLEIFDEVSLNSHPLTKAIESAAETEDLISIANDDLSYVIKNLPLGKQNNVNRKQDQLINHRIMQQSINSAASAKISRGASRKISVYGMKNNM